METLRGNVLISNGDLFDPNFRHTVVLIGEHNEEGALGVILNRPLDVTIADSVPPLVGLAAPDDLLYEGGPVQPESVVLLAEFSRPDLADLRVFDSVGFLIGEVDDQVAPSVLRARIFAGYAGWGPGQLEGEMAENSWIVDPARVEDVFTEEPDHLWRRILERKGPEYRALSKMPYDPSMN